MSKSARISQLTVAMAALAVLSMGLVGCDEDNGADDGTITVALTGAAASNGDDFMFAVFAPGADIDVDDPLGMGVELIALGVASGPAMDLDTGTVAVEFDGGDKYDVYVLIDEDGEMDIDTGELIGSQMGIEVDGDTTVTFAYASLVAAP